LSSCREGPGDTAATLAEECIVGCLHSRGKARLLCGQGGSLMGGDRRTSYYTNQYFDYFRRRDKAWLLILRLLLLLSHVPHKIRLVSRSQCCLVLSSTIVS